VRDQPHLRVERRAARAARIRVDAPSQTFVTIRQPDQRGRERVHEQLVDPRRPHAVRRPVAVHENDPADRRRVDAGQVADDRRAAGVADEQRVPQPQRGQESQQLRGVRAQRVGAAALRETEAPHVDRIDPVSSGREPWTDARPHLRRLEEPVDQHDQAAGRPPLLVVRDHVAGPDPVAVRVERRDRHGAAAGDVVDEGPNGDGDGQRDQEQRRLAHGPTDHANLGTGSGRGW